MIMLKVLWGRVWPYIAAIGAAFAAVLAIRQSGKAVGRQETRQEINEANQKAVEAAREELQNVAAMDDDATRRAASSWVRGNK